MIYDTFYKSFVDREFTPMGRPLDYPTPENDDLLFFIQNSTNKNTIVYNLNRNSANQINEELPMLSNWIYFEKDPITTKCLNDIQQRLAYGYNSKVINKDLIEFNFVCHTKKFFLTRNNEKWDVISKFGELYYSLSHIFVYVEEYGVFPEVKFVEFFGKNSETGEELYDKMVNV